MNISDVESIGLFSILVVLKVEVTIVLFWSSCRFWLFLNLGHVEVLSMFLFALKVKSDVEAELKTAQTSCAEVLAILDARKDDV